MATAAIVAGCKREPTPEEIAKLPHVTRPWGKVVSVRAVPEHRIDAATACYDAALAKAPGQNGSITVTFRPKEGGATQRTIDRTGNLTPELAECVAQAVDEPGARQAGTVETVALTLSSEDRREPAPPGDAAFRLVVGRMLSKGDLTVTDLVIGNPRDEVYGGQRARLADCVVRARFDTAGEDHFCGELGPPGPRHQRGRVEDVCPAQPRAKGATIDLRGPCRFTLRRGGWMFGSGEYEDGRLFYGDVVRGG